MLSEDEFMDTYNPIQAGREGEFQFETHQQALEFAESRGLTNYHVWTIIESGDGDDDALYVSAGNHLVNRIGYLVTEKAWVTGIEDGVWMEDDFDDDSEDEELSDHG